MSDVILQTFYSEVSTPVPKYRFAQLGLNNSTSNSITLQPTSIAFAEYKIPASSVFNASRSLVSANWTLPALASNYGYFFEDIGLWDRAFFGAQGSQGIVDIPSGAGEYVHTTLPIYTKLNDLLSSDQLSGFYPSNQLQYNNIFPTSKNGLTAGTENSSTVPYTEYQHLLMASAPNTAITKNILCPLSCIKRSFLSQDIDSVFAQDMFLRLWWQPICRMGSYTTAPANPNSNNTVPTLTATMSNMYLYLAVEQNLDIREMLLKNLSSGSIIMSIDYPVVNSYPTAGNTPSVNINLTLNRGNGRGVRSILTSFYNAQKNTQFGWSKNNTNGCKVSTFQSFLNSRPQQDMQIACYNPNSSILPTSSGLTSGQANQAQDWMNVKPYLKGSCIQNYPQYQTVWSWIDDWSSILPNVDSSIGTPMVPNYCVEEYLSLEGSDQQYSIQAGSGALTGATSDCFANGLLTYVFQIFARTLTIQPTGILISE